MKLYLLLLVLLGCFLSCKIKPEKIAAAVNNIQLLIPDTTKNERAKRDLERIEYHTKISKQLGLNDFKKGADSFEIRAWYSFSFSNSQELYDLKVLDTNYTISYYRFYCRQIDYENENRNRDWNPFTNPIIDSFVSKSILLKKKDCDSLGLNMFWSLRSECELNIPDSIGFLDCYGNTLEIADKHKYKLLSYHCANALYEATKFKQILDFEEGFNKIAALAYKHNAVVPYDFPK